MTTSTLIPAPDRIQPRRSGRALLRGAVIVAAAALSVAGVALPAQASTAPAKTLSASPSGTGKSCSTSAPCSLTTALALAPAGAKISLRAGNYGNADLHGGHGTAAQPVTVQGAAGRTSVFAKLKTGAPYVHWTSVTAITAFYMYPSALGTQVDAVTLRGAGMFVHSNNTTVENSEFSDGKSIDGINIGGAHGVVIRNNNVHNYNQSGTSGLHADCIQLFDSSHITIVGNKLHNCYNSGIIFSGGSNKGISDVDVESNFVEGCLVKSKLCNNGNDLDLRYGKVANITVRYNTFAFGTVELGSPNVVFDHNIVHYLSECKVQLTNSIVEEWNHGLCKAPTALGKNGNRQSVVDFVDPATDDLRLLVPSQAKVAATIHPMIAKTAKDIDGRSIQSGYAGAFVPTVTKAAKPDTKSPAVRIAAPTNGLAANGVLHANAAASDNVKVVSVRFYINGTLAGRASLAQGQWQSSIDVSALRHKTYKLSADAVDAAGNTTSSSTVLLRVH